MTTTFQMETIPVQGYEKVLKINDPSSGLKALIAIHDTTLGPALGGIRICSYPDFDSALTDVLRLSRGMSHKAAIAGCGLGGGKSVIIADPKKGEKTKELLEAFAEIVHSLGGQYICAEDMGCTADDVAIIQKRTPYVVGLEHEKGSGDPSYFTAWGTYIGMQYSWSYLTKTQSLEGVKVLVQGLGAVGEKLVEWLFWAGAEVYVTDIDLSKVEKLKKRFGVQFVDPKAVYHFDCDIFAPCAMGGILKEEIIPHLKCRLIAGCANNQLLEEEDDQRLKDRKILYAPDMVINAGGLINAVLEIEKDGYNPKVSRAQVAKICDRLKMIYEIAESKNIGTQKAALILAEERIKNLIDKRLEGPYFHNA